MRVPVNPTPQNYSDYPTETQGYEQPVDYTAGQRQLAAVVDKYAQYAAEQQQKTEMFNVQKMVVDESNNIQQDFDKKIQVQPLGAPNFVQQVAGEYTTRHDQMVQQLRDQGYSTDAVDEFATRLGALRSQMVAKAIDFQEKSRFTKGVNDLKDLSTSLSQYANANPYATPTALNELHVGIANSGLNPVEQAQVKQALEDPIVTGAREGFAVQHPEMVLGLYGLPTDLTSTSPTNLPNGQTFSLPTYMQKLLPAEGVGKNPKSTAQGFGQFLNSTWLGTYKEVYGNTGETDAQILAKKNNRDIATKLTEQLTNDNIQKLNAAGAPVNDATVYLAHFLGISDALKVINAHADASISSLVHSASIAANAKVFKNIHNAGDMLAWAQQKMGDANIVASSTPSLPPIPPGWKGNVEDAIQELGMTADQAQTYISTGKDTRVPGQVSTANQGPTQVPTGLLTQSGLAFDENGKTGITALDEASGPERMQMLTLARTVMNERERAATAQQNSSHEIWMNQFLNDIYDGKKGQADINAAQTQGLFKTFEERQQAQNVFDSKNKQNDDLSRFSLLLNSGVKANPFDPDAKKAVDAGYAAAVKFSADHGNFADPFVIGLREWQRTGILPSQAAVMIRGALAASDPNQVASAASVASNMIAQNPNAFAGVEGGDEIAKDAVTYKHYVDDLGMTSAEAAAKIAQANSPEFKAKVSANEFARNQFQLSITGDKTQSGVNVQKIILGSPGIFGRIGNWFSGSAPQGMSAPQLAEANQTYLELALDNYDKFHDPSAANAYAAQQMQRLYGVEGGRIVKYPASKSYPLINGNNDYVLDQAKEFVDKAAGQSIPVKDIWLQPTITGSTAEAFRNGTPPPYEVHYITPDNVYHVIPGEVFVADVDKARVDAAKKAAAYEQQLRRNTAAMQSVMRAKGGG